MRIHQLCSLPCRAACMCDSPGNLSTLTRRMTNRKRLDALFLGVLSLDQDHASLGEDTLSRSLRSAATRTSTCALDQAQRARLQLTASSRSKPTVPSASSSAYRPSSDVQSMPNSKKRCPCLPSRFLVLVSCAQQLRQWSSQREQRQGLTFMNASRALPALTASGGRKFSFLDTTERSSASRDAR